MASQTIAAVNDIERIREVLDSPEIRDLIAEATSWTGRPGYGVRAMVGMVLVKFNYNIPVWSRVARMVREHPALRELLGCAPSAPACYRFNAKFAESPWMSAACVKALESALRRERPEYGSGAIAIDGSGLSAYANGMRNMPDGTPRKNFSDPDATWGHRSAISTQAGGGFYGYKVHAVVCAETDLPIAWTTLTASAAEQPQVPDLLDTVLDRGFRPTCAIMDKGYDGAPTYNACEARGMHPIIPLKLTAEVENGRDKPPRCKHGQWKFAGASVRRQTAKWRCPTGECEPASTWIRADRLHTLVPRNTPRWKDLYAKRGSVEREFGRLKHEWGMLPLRTRTLRRVSVHVDFSILTCLAMALADARRSQVPIAA